MKNILPCKLSVFMINPVFDHFLGLALKEFGIEYRHVPENLSIIQRLHFFITLVKIFSSKLLLNLKQHTTQQA